MTKELVPLQRGNHLETVAEKTWQQFVNRANELGGKLCRTYEQSPVERQEYYRDVCQGGYNFGKTIGWVVDYSPSPEALEGIGSALEAIAEWPNAGSMAWEIRRFIKGSSKAGYNNITDVVEFGELIKKIGDDDPTNKKGFQLDMDFFYWDSGWGIDGESTNEEILQAHCRNVTEVVKGLKRYAHPEIIEMEAKPTQEEIEAKEKAEREKYWKDFLADAKYHNRVPSFFDVLDREELINRPHHKIVTYPVPFCDVLHSPVWNPYGHTDVNDAVTAYYRYLPHMTIKRADKNWFPRPLPPDYTDYYTEKFERRLQRTSEQKPWLIDFSVKWQDMLQRSFVGGNHDTSHEGEVELIYKNPAYDPSKKGYLSNDEYEWRRLEIEEERLFFESVTDVQSLEDLEPPVKPPKQYAVFNGQTGRPYLLKLTDGREFQSFIKHEYGSLFWEGKIVVIAQDGPELLFQTQKQELKD